MSIDLQGLDSLSPSEKLELVERLWDDLADSNTPIPLPEWVDQMAARRRDEMHDPTVGRSHEETWRRIDGRR